MRPRETEAPTVAPLVTGYFEERRNYSTWRSHGTSDYLLMYTVGGAGRIGFSRTDTSGRSGERVVEAGDAVLIAPHVRHDYGTARGASGWNLLWAHFLPYPHWQDWLQWPEITPGTRGVGLLSLTGEVATAVNESLRTMHQRATGGLARREAFAMNALEEALLWCETINPVAARAVRDARVQHAIQHLKASLAEPVSLTDLARCVGLSPSRLSFLFREQVGLTPGQFLERERIERARQLLTLTSQSIATIAAEVGFESPFYFTLRFRKHTGMSPRAFRTLRHGAGEPNK